VEELISHGEVSASILTSHGRSEFSAEPSVRLDYFEIVNPDTLDSIQDISKGALIAVAAYVGSTRLIDNLLIKR
jgi:pantoate--beta-alanine ligase